MGLLGNQWGPSGDPKVFSADDGRKLTMTIFENGYTVSDEGGTTQVPHMEATDDPEVFRIGGQLFRKLP